MKHIYQNISLLIITMVLISGCSSFPGTEDENSAKFIGKEIIVDNESATGFRSEGEWASDEGDGGENYGEDSLWAYENEDGQDKAFWNPELPVDGYYDIYIWYCDDPNGDHATKAPFIIKAHDNEHKFSVNLQENIGKWNLLGTFPMEEGTGTYVYTQADESGNAIADAVRFIYKGKEKK